MSMKISIEEAFILEEKVWTFMATYKSKSKEVTFWASKLTEIHPEFEDIEAHSGLCQYQKEHKNTTCPISVLSEFRCKKSGFRGFCGCTTDEESPYCTWHENPTNKNANKVLKHVQRRRKAFIAGKITVNSDNKFSISDKNISF